MNERAKKNLSCKVSLLDIQGTDYLLYQAPKPDYALIRAPFQMKWKFVITRMKEYEGTVLSIAQAAKSETTSGTVIAQVDG